MNFSRDGDVTVFTQGTGSINSSADFSTVIGLPGWVKIVNQIDFCGGLMRPGILGCSPTPGNSLVVADLPRASRAFFGTMSSGTIKG